ncbi:MAG: GAF domain-containing sensor histidine kinase [Deltaproteobacteria bacterium]|nr:GAF domain-containing sensor histidine kinase [Deltaproteobacteria bacterium]
MQEQSQSDRIRKLHSLLELGQLIGLDLKLDEMLLRIAQKACEVMESDRCTLFLHDPTTDELWSKVALGMGGQVIRIPCGAGIAGHCFQTGETINLADAYADSRFNKEVDENTGYHTRSLYCAPVHNRDGQRLGVIQLLNKKDGVFTREDETFLHVFSNHASIFIEIVQLQKARIDALEKSRKELKRLNRVKSKALDHLSHELKTPLSVIRGNINLLKKKLPAEPSSGRMVPLFETLERNLNRILGIQEETDNIIRSYQELERGFSPEEMDRKGSARAESIPLLPFAEKILEKVKERSAHRDIRFQLEVAGNHQVSMDPGILENILVGLLKNAVENTPDEGTIRILSERKDGRILLKVQDFGVGITEENQKSIFDGLFHTQETDLYTSRKPYNFNAGGKGLDLLKMKVYGQGFGFDLTVESRRCMYLPTDRDICPGRISACPHCHRPEDCQSFGESTFSVSFPDRA